MIKLQDITKEYHMGTQTVHALRGVDLTVEDGAAITPPLTFFQVRAVNSCNEESP